MSKTLVVSYLPNTDSVTKQALDHFLAAAQGKTTLVHRDLTRTLPPVFNQTSLAAYKLRGFGGQTLNEEHAQAIRPFDDLIEEISGVDHVVFAFPTHNWSEPGAVKLYIDAISQYGKLIRYGANGPEGILKNHKAFVLFASGGQYPEGHPRRTIQPAFTFFLNAIGVQDIEFAPIEGTLMGPEVTAESLTKVKAQIDGLANRWYSASQQTA